MQMETIGTTCLLETNSRIIDQEKISRASSVIGEIGAMYAKSVFLLLGFNVYKPEVEGRADDFTIEKNGSFAKVQCKTTCNKKNFRLNLTRRINWTGQGYYKDGDFDYIALVAPHGLYLVPSIDVIGKKSYVVLESQKIFNGITLFD